MTTPEGITLPQWNDAASVASYLTSLFGAVVAVLALVHPGFAVPQVAQAVILGLASLIAGGAQIANLIWHRKVEIAAIEATAYGK